jgi:sec-independent protein translocase protein TatC
MGVINHAPTKAEMMNEQRLSIIEHLEELRSRLIRVCIGISLGTVIGLIFSKPLYQIISGPMRASLPEGSFFIATEPIEALMAYLKVGLVAGVFLAMPYAFYQLWLFIAPGLKRGEKSGALLVTIVTSAFFIGGALFGYFVVFPMSFKFFSTILVGTDIHFLPSMRVYLSFAIRLLLAFGIIFELPVLILALARAGIVTHRQLAKARPYCVLGIFVLAALLTPPDVISQILMAGPLLLLFEASLILARFFGRS